LLYLIGLLFERFAYSGNDHSRNGNKNKDEQGQFYTYEKHDNNSEENGKGFPYDKFQNGKKGVLYLQDVRRYPRNYIPFSLFGKIGDRQIYYLSVHTVPNVLQNPV